jgi:mono/diheme cytochrome c family protein
MALWLCLLLVGQDAPHPVVPGFERFTDLDPAEGGRLLLGELGCVACHKTADAPPVKKAPILTAVGDRISPAWIREFISDPQTAKRGTTMPRPQATPDEVEALTHFLMSLKGAKPPEVGGGAPVQAADVFNKVGCAACHDPIGKPPVPGSVPLPDLKAKYASASALAQFLLDPLAVRPSGRMPKMNLTPAEAVSLGAHFIGLPPREPDLPGDVVPGMTVEYFEGEFSKVADLDRAKPVTTAAAESFDLKCLKKQDHVGLRFTGYVEIPKDGLYSFFTSSDDGSTMRIGSYLVVNNDGVHGTQEQGGSMFLKKGKHAFTVGWFDQGGGEELHVRWAGPGFEKRSIPASSLTRPKEGAVVLKEQPTAAALFVSEAPLVAKGRELFQSKGCAGCHDAGPGFKPVDARPLVAGHCKPLDFGLNGRQEKAIEAAVAKAEEKPSPAKKVERTMLALHCFACHERGKRGGVGQERYAAFTTTYEDTGDEGKVPPHLNGVGAKLKREWLQTVLNTAPKVRPYMNTRMPVFGPANVAGLADEFEKADEPAAAAGEPRSAELIKAGRLLTGTKGLSCVQCHMFQNQKSLGIPGMDLVHMSQRLRREWFAAYLLDPAGLRPGTRMPTFWPEGKSVRKDILEGDTPRQVEAIWQYLSEGGKAPMPVGVGPQPILLVPPPGEALLYRNFISGAGTRAIGVGYPERANLAWDANQMRPALIWQGDFIDAAKHWLDRGAGSQGPAGENVVALPDGAPFAVLATESAPWPKESGKKAGYQFGGYDLDAKRRPTFLYTWNQVEVRDFFEAVEGKPNPGFKRTLTLQSKEAVANAWFRAAAAKSALKIGVDGATPVARGNELLVPLDLKGGKRTLVLTYTW